MTNKHPLTIDGNLRKFALRVPEAIKECSGIIILGKLIKSLVFSTDLSIIRNVNADAIIAVYPFTPQPIITQALMTAADIPLFCGVGGGWTCDTKRVVNLATFAEMQGAMGVVLNAPATVKTIKAVANRIDIPIIATIVNDAPDVAEKLEAGAKILNVSGAALTPGIIRNLRERFPDIPIIATGGPTNETIRATIEAGANAVTWTPPSNGEIYKDIMEAYRKNQPHP